MRLKTSLLALTASMALSPLIAQDRIYTVDGEMQEVKIKEVGTRTVIYKKWNNQDGPDFVIPKGEVQRIKFQNGDEESFNRMGRLMPRKADKTRSSANYGKNIVCFAPIFMTNVSATGFGLSYERVIDRNNIVSFYLPVAYSFRNANTYGYNPANVLEDESKMVWFYPGAKIYPTGSDGIVRYSVGPSLAFGTGSRDYSQQTWDPPSNSYVVTRYSDELFVMGILINNSLNIQPTPKLHLGLEVGIGIPYYISEDNSSNSNNYYYNNTFDNVPLVQFNFHAGFRF